MRDIKLLFIAVRKTRRDYLSLAHIDHVVFNSCLALNEQNNHHSRSNGLHRLFLFLTVSWAILLNIFLLFVVWWKTGIYGVFPAVVLLQFNLIEQTNDQRQSNRDNLAFWRRPFPSFFFLLVEQLGGLSIDSEASDAN